MQIIIQMYEDIYFSRIQVVVFSYASLSILGHSVAKICNSIEAYIL